jgi:hypothetical protein
MERPPTEAPKAGPVLGIAGILTAFGWVFCVMAVATAMDGGWGAAAIRFILSIVAWVFAFKWYAFYATFSERRIHALLAQRDESLRHVDELRRYANFCELEAKCWPEDSVDRAELVAYAHIARMQADETFHKWREIERKLRAERFEQITKRS